MWDCTSAYPSDVTKFVPPVCPVQPVNGKAFCLGVYISLKDVRKGIKCLVIELPGRSSYSNA